MEFIRKKNRKLVCLLLSLIMAASVLTPLVNTYAAQVDCTDKILNPSFEIGTVGQAPSNWTRTGGTYA
ncbi:MAG: hypothetical protein FWH57_13515, partial [Oscillospiraceae bacterium]|nr:hypothetical protein [Oscillospiraceae bacterium]